MEEARIRNVECLEKKKERKHTSENKKTYCRVKGTKISKAKQQRMRKVELLDSQITERILVEGTS